HDADDHLRRYRPCDLSDDLGRLRASRPAAQRKLGHGTAETGLRVDAGPAGGVHASTDQSATAASGAIHRRAVMQSGTIRRMRFAEPVTIVQTRALTRYELDEWAQLCAQRLDTGERMVTLFGRPISDNGVITTAVFQGDGIRFSVLRGLGKRGQAFPSLTVRHPSVQMFERELWEQTGLIPTGHPWLKPVRFEGERQQHMQEYPFFSVRGEEVHEVGVGPIHASVIEPEHFRFMCHGEKVHHLEIQLGYQHRGVEALLLRRPPLAL